MGVGYEGSLNSQLKSFAHRFPAALQSARGGELLHLGEHVEETAVAAGRERLRETARLDNPGSREKEQ